MNDVRLICNYRGTNRLINAVDALPGPVQAAIYTAPEGCTYEYARTESGTATQGAEDVYVCNGSCR